MKLYMVLSHSNFQGYGCWLPLPVKWALVAMGHASSIALLRDGCYKKGMGFQRNHNCEVLVSLFIHSTVLPRAEMRFRQLWLRLYSVLSHKKVETSQCYQERNWWMDHTTRGRHGAILTAAHEYNKVCIIINNEIKLVRNDHGLTGVMAFDGRPWVR